MAESSHTDISALVKERVKCFACSRRFLDPRLLSCHHTFCIGCLQNRVINDSVKCPECQAVLNLTAGGLEGLPKSDIIIQLLEVVKAQEVIGLAIRDRHAHDRNLHYRTPDIAMVTPPRTASDERHGAIAMVTPSMPGYAERRGTWFMDRGMFLGGCPCCIAVSAAADRLYATDRYHHKVMIYDDGGRLIKTARDPGFSLMGPKRGLKEPHGIAVNMLGDVIVADTDNHRVVILDRDGVYQSTFGKHGEKDGQFRRPLGVAVDDACTIYVCDAGNHRIQVFTHHGKYLRTFDKPDNVSGGFIPWYLSIARTTGLVYVTDWLNHRVCVYTPLGQYITCFGTEGRGEGEMYEPHGICVDDDGRVIIADNGNHRVQVYNGDGTYHCTLVLAHNAPQLYSPDGLTIDKNGHVFVVDAGNDRVLVF